MVGESISNSFKVKFNVSFDKGDRIISERNGVAKIRSDRSNLDSYYSELANFLKAQLLNKGRNVINLRIDSIENDKSPKK